MSGKLKSLTNDLNDKNNEEIIFIFLLTIVLSVDAKKKVTSQQPQWPDGSVMTEWFTDTMKVDVKTLGRQYVITKYGVKNDPTILQTKQIQDVIDRCAKDGGGVVVIPRGTFLTGALFFKKGTHLHFEDGACLKGGKGTFVDNDSTAGPVNRVLVEQCRFGNHVNAAVTFGSESWNSHNVILRHCKMENSHRLLLFKMRPDTPQQYGDVLVEHCTGITQHSAIEASTWTQFYNKQERKDMPASGVRNVTVRNIDIKTANFLKVEMKEPFTLSDFTLQDIRATDKHNSFNCDKIERLTVKDVILNGIKK